MFDRFFFAQHLEEDEKAVLIVHKHWVFGLRVLFWPAVSFIAAWLLLWREPTRIVLIIIAVWSFLSIVWFARNFFDYFLDVWIITDHGIIDLAWFGWFHRQSTRILYSDVQGVAYERKGIPAALCGYGTLTVEKISTGSVISLPYVHHPKRVEGIMLRTMEAYLHGKNLKNAKHVQDILADFIAQHVQETTLQPKQPERNSFLVSE
ncbi:hypothetical protein HY285_04765 [Candidatus Peregrinibacteria bacterium]|nr:hypothetical protein [Candidatus Peregrinibacteria bacterium]MBI3816823.1 hypothetical protein [Candidatus Peregrinibacteria bacterium]